MFSPQNPENNQNSSFHFNSFNFRDDLSNNPQINPLQINPPQNTILNPFSHRPQVTPNNNPRIISMNMWRNPEHSREFQPGTNFPQRDNAQRNHPNPANNHPTSANSGNRHSMQVQNVSPFVLRPNQIRTRRIRTMQPEGEFIPNRTGGNNQQRIGLIQNFNRLASRINEVNTRREEMRARRANIEQMNVDDRQRRHSSILRVLNQFEHVQGGFGDFLRNFNDNEFPQNGILGVKRSNFSFSGENQGHVKKVLEKNKEFFDNADICQIRKRNKTKEENEGKKQGVCAKSINDKVGLTRSSCTASTVESRTTRASASSAF